MFNRAAFIRAVRGPVVMIAIGLLFVLDQSGVVRVSATWPFLLIVFGLFKLAERLLAPTPNASPNTWTGAPGGNSGGLQQ